MYIQAHSHLFWWKMYGKAKKEYSKKTHFFQTVVSYYPPFQKMCLLIIWKSFVHILIWIYLMARVHSEILSIMWNVTIILYKKKLFTFRRNYHYFINIQTQNFENSASAIFCASSHKGDYTYAVFGKHQIVEEVCTALRQIVSALIQIYGMCHIEFESNWKVESFK